VTLSLLFWDDLLGKDSSLFVIYSKERCKNDPLKPPSLATFIYTLATGQPAFRAITNGQGPQNLAKQIQE
jgi:hypothetical protein